MKKVSALKSTATLKLLVGNRDGGSHKIFNFKLKGNRYSHQTSRHDVNENDMPRDILVPLLSNVTHL